MSLREFIREREMLLFLLAIAAFFMAVGVLFQIPGPGSDRQGDDPSDRTLRQMGLEDPSLHDDGRPTLPGVLEDWNRQLLIGH
jgi:hypothetical protein